MLEEVVLLAVDESTGGLRATRQYGAAYALVGAVFFDLALARRIDTDTDGIQILDKSPTGSPTLDRVLSAIRAGKTLQEVVASKPTADFDQGRMGGAITPDRFVTLVYQDLSRKK